MSLDGPDNVPSEEGTSTYICNHRRVRLVTDLTSYREFTWKPPPITTMYINQLSLLPRLAYPVACTSMKNSIPLQLQDESFFSLIYGRHRSVGL